MKIRTYGPPARPGFSSLLNVEQQLRSAINTGMDADVDVCLYPCTEVPPLDKPTVLVCHDPQQWGHIPAFKKILAHACMVVAPSDNGTFVSHPRGQRLGDIAALVRAIEGLAPSKAARFLFVLNSLGCSGVTRSVLDMIAELPEDIRQACAILPISRARLSLPIPDGVTVLEPGAKPEYAIRQMGSALRAVWVQPLVTTPALVLEACKVYGVAAYWLLCSQAPAIVAECQHASRTGGTAVVTGESLKPLGETMARSVFVPHYVSAGLARTGKRSHWLGYVGRLSHEKNVLGLPAVLAALPADYTLDVFAPMLASPGRANSEQAHAAMVAAFEERGLAARVRWHFDELNREAIFREFDTLLLPSKYEGFSLAAHEALSVGVTVVCADETPLATEGNPGVFTFRMAGEADQRPLDGPAVVAMAEAIKAAGKPTFAKVAKASLSHGLEAWRVQHLPALLELFPRAQPSTGGAKSPSPFDRKWHGPERWASLASIPSRIELLGKTVASLLPQVDRVNVYLNGYDSVPGFLSHPRVHVATSQDRSDRGDAGKFYWVEKCSGYYCTADDDIIYPTDYVSTLVDAIEDRGRMAVVGFHGNVLPKNFESYYVSRINYRFGLALDHDQPVDILGTGVCGFHVSTMRLRPDDFRSPNMADVWLAKAARNQGVPLVTLAHRGGWIIPQKVPSGIYEVHLREPGKQDTVLLEMGNFGQPKDVPVAPARKAGAPNVVSTLIASYHSKPEWLRAAIASVLAQELPAGWRHEVLVGFDGCDPIPLPDGVGAVASEKNHGPYVMANLLASLATGAWISRVDSDDLVVPTRLKSLLSVCPAGGIAGSGWANLGEGEQPGQRPVEGAWLVSRSVLATLGGYAPWRCGADTEFLSRASQAQIPRGADPAATYLYRKHEAQLTSAADTGFGSGLRRYYSDRINKGSPMVRPAYVPTRWTWVHRPALLNSTRP